ncbi:MAG: hypothetical protein GXP26_14420 [Planctomycetes bacterium]|nr:hypothetical protein [Planctomycetota bacterium]
MIDSEGRPIQLGAEIGKGGEGSVFEIEGKPSVVAKIYHQKPLPEDQVAKLEIVIKQWSETLDAISAWPHSFVYDERTKQPRGLIMPKIVAARHLHELYGSTNRRLHFPEAYWHHLVLAARNVAAAFEAFHSNGIVVGDVNQGNLMVDQSMCVRMIDCDSFQITGRDQTFFCPVGTPHFTPPELQSKKLRDVYRTKNHDAFGMAVLIFHLLFVGRHPFAGRYRGAGDMTIEKAIGERRFAFSKHRGETLLDPPPASLQLTDLPPSLAALFEAAFRADVENGDVRPTAKQWVIELETLIKQRKSCSFEPVHVYFGGLRDCPWCRIEDEGGPAFFITSGNTTIISPERLDLLDEKIQELRIKAFPDLSIKRLDLPGIPLLKKLEVMPKRQKIDAVALAFVAMCVLSLAGIWHGGALLAGTVGALACCGYFLFGKEPSGRRKKVDGFIAALANGHEKLLKVARGIAGAHQQRNREFDTAVEGLKVEIQHYGAEGNELKEVLKLHSGSQKRDFLRKHLIRDSFGDIRGLKRMMVPMLESFGVDSALDINRLNLYGVPSIDPSLVMELLNWRATIEQKYKFKPSHGVTIQEMKRSEQVTTHRFKLSQSRKVLMASTRLNSLADGGRLELERSISYFDSLTGQWLGVAKQLRDFQSSRYRTERMINHSPAVLLGIALGVPFASLLLYLMFR